MAQSRLKLGAYLRPHWRQATLGILALFVVNAVCLHPLLIRIIDKLQVTFSFDQVLSYGGTDHRLSSSDVGNPDGIPDHAIWGGGRQVIGPEAKDFSTLAEAGAVLFCSEHSWRLD